MERKSFPLLTITWARWKKGKKKSTSLSIRASIKPSGRLTSNPLRTTSNSTSSFWHSRLMRSYSNKWENTKARNSPTLSPHTKKLRRTLELSMTRVTSQEFQKKTLPVSVYGSRTSFKTAFLKFKSRSVSQTRQHLWQDKCLQACALWCKWWNRVKVVCQVVLIASRWQKTTLWNSTQLTRLLSTSTNFANLIKKQPH